MYNFAAGEGRVGCAACDRAFTQEDWNKAKREFYEKASDVERRYLDGMPGPTCTSSYLRITREEADKLVKQYRKSLEPCIVDNPVKE
jgi:hypothetical protein